jgi:hypothetical protein
MPRDHTMPFTVTVHVYSNDAPISEGCAKLLMYDGYINQSLIYGAETNERTTRVSPDESPSFPHSEPDYSNYDNPKSDNKRNVNEDVAVVIVCPETE